MPVYPECLRASFTGRPVKVDREKKILMGYVVAQEGPFKSDGRGAFDELSLRQVVQLGNTARGGLKSRFTHPNASDDGLGKFLGRSRNLAMSTATNAEGKTVKAVRADLHFNPTAHDTPHGDLAGYVMRLAESDPDALSSSIVLKADKEQRRKKDGTLELDADGEPLPPLWRPKMLIASDIVDTGDAVDGLLSAHDLSQALSGGEIPDALLRWDNVSRLSAQMIDGLFAGQTREVVEERCKSYLGRYLSRRFGEAEPVEKVITPRLDKLSERMAKMGIIEKIPDNRG